MSTHHDYHQQQEAKSRRRHLQTAASEAVEAGHKALSTSDHETLAVVVRETILPLSGVDEGLLNVYADAATVSSGVEFDADAVQSVLRHGTTGVAPTTLKAAFESLESVLVLQGIIQGNLQTEQPVLGLETQLGIRYLRPTSNSGGTLTLYEPDDQLGKILFAGGTGAGKSTGVASMGEDRYAAGHKIIDLLDLFKAENAMWDVEGRDETLNEVRAEELGLPVGFGDDYDSPDIEILAPLTPGLEDSRVPVNTDTGESVVSPFTIPASELNYRQLVMLLEHTTKTQENYLKSAHQKLRNSPRDWTLADLAEVVRVETNASDKVADRIERSLETAQQKSFIRDKQCDHQMDMQEIMADQETVTSFTCFQMKEKSDKLLVASFLLDKVLDAREYLNSRGRIHEFPPLSVVIREIHQVAPRKKSEQDAKSTIEGYMVNTLEDIFALCRHADMEVISDTQQFKQQLSPGVSGLYDEIFAFQGQRPDIKEIFKTRVDNTSAASTVAEYEVGKCAHVSGDGYTLPIAIAPPRAHHLDARRDGDGLSFRARHLDDEELQDAPWSADVPVRLSFDAIRNEDPDPHEKFLKRVLRRTGDRGDRVWTTDISDVWAVARDREGFDRLADDEQRAHRKLISTIRDIYDVDDDEVGSRKHPHYEKMLSARLGFTWNKSGMTDKELEALPDGL